MRDSECETNHLVVLWAFLIKKKGHERKKCEINDSWSKIFAGIKGMNPVWKIIS